MDALHIKKQRRALHLTQQELAEKANVSQSFIAKIEAGLINPSYTLATRILNVLEREQMQQQPSAKELAHKPLVTCAPQDSVKTVIRRMRKQAISQVPVVEDKTVIGLVTETGLLDHMLDKNPEHLIVQDVMRSPPPLLDASTPQAAVLSLLKHSPLIVVTEKGKLYGAITRTDMIVNQYA